MDLTRRSTLRGAAAAAASLVPVGRMSPLAGVAAEAGTLPAGTLPAGALPAGTLPAGALPMGKSWFSRSTYAPLVGSWFALASTQVRLVEIGGHGAREPEEARFSLLFEGRTGPARLGQGTYRVSHPSLGTGSLFLVPIGRPATMPRLEAVVNSPVAPK